MADSNVTPLVEHRAATARELVFNAQGVCVAVALALKAMSPIDGDLEGGDADMCRRALQAAVDLLEDVAGALEPGAMTQPVTDEEQEVRS